MMKKYSIVIYQNGKRKKHLQSFDSYQDSVEFYNTFLEDNYVVFPKKRVKLDTNIKHELAIINNSSNGDKQYEDNTTIKKICTIKIEEKVYNPNTKKRYTLIQVIKNFIKGRYNLNFYHIHNKFVIEDIINSTYDIFILKDVSDCVRFFNLVTSITKNNLGYNGFIFFTTISKDKQGDIIDNIIDQYGVTRHYMLRQVTRTY